MAQAQEQLQDPLATLENFNQLSDETQATIFSGLGVSDLKHCRLVCKTWNEQVSSQNLLHSRVVLVHKENKSRTSFWKNLLRALHLARKKGLYTIPTFRFKDTVGASVFLWLTNNHMVNVTSVEFQNCSLYIHQVLLLFRQMPHVKSLTISGIDSSLTYKDDKFPSHRDFMKPYYMEESMANFQKLKKCDIEVHEKTKFHAFVELLMLKCNQIEEFRLSYPDKYGWEHPDIYTRLGNYIKTLGNTLRVLSFKFNPNTDRHQPIFGNPAQQRVQSSLGNLDRLLENMRFKQWTNFNLDKLEEFSLDFQLTTSNLPRIQAVLAPFLLNLKSLKKFSFGTLSVSTGEEDGVFNIVPPACNLAKIDSIQRTDQNALGNNNPLVIIAQVPDPLNLSRMEISTGNLNLKMAKVAWDVEFTRTMVLDRLEGLTKLNVYQLQVPQQQQLQVTNDFLQRIIERATNLVELSLEYCAFENLSDFGITGISAEAGLRMRTHGDYNIQNGDQTGVSLSRLTRLQIFRMATGLTGSVTDVTARLAFTGNPRMRILSLSMPQFTEDGLTALREIFAANKIIKIDIGIGLPAEQN